MINQQKISTKKMKCSGPHIGIPIENYSLKLVVDELNINVIAYLGTLVTRFATLAYLNLLVQVFKL